MKKYSREEIVKMLCESIATSQNEDIEEIARAQGFDVELCEDDNGNEWFEGEEE